jgi:hypothetical protein
MWWWALAYGDGDGDVVVLAVRFFVVGCISSG